MSIVDLDRTLTKRGTYSPFLLYAARRYAPWRLALVPVVLACMLTHKTRMISRKRLKELMQLLILGRTVPAPILANIAEDYARHVLRSNLRRGVEDFLARERAEGRAIILATAAHRFYAEPIARKLGISEVVATESVRSGLAVTHRIAGENCYGPAKARAAADTIERLGLDLRSVDVRVFSDDHSDLPLFMMSDQKVAIHPSRKLRQHLNGRGWSVLSLDE